MLFSPTLPDLQFSNMNSFTGAENRNLRKKRFSTAFLLFLSILLLTLETESRAEMDYKTRLELAQAHYERVLFKISCGTPLPRVISVDTPELRLVPSATILHRCGDYTGCCDTDAQKCVAKTQENVKLYFFVKSVKRQWRHGRRHKIKKMLFSNHTECHCVDKTNKPR